MLSPGKCVHCCSVRHFVNARIGENDAIFTEIVDFCKDTPCGKWYPIVHKAARGAKVQFAPVCCIISREDDNFERETVLHDDRVARYFAPLEEPENTSFSTITFYAPHHH